MLGICISIKNRSCIIVPEEDSLNFLNEENKEKVIDSPKDKYTPWKTKEGNIILTLMPKMLRSLMSHKRPEDNWLLVIVDSNSTDVDMKHMLEYEVGDKMKWIIEKVTDYEYFDRGGGLAKAAEIAEKNGATDLFFCDADIYFGERTVLDEAIKSISEGKYFYPIFFSYVMPDHTKGLWRDTSFGNFATSVENYKKTPGWMHNISWGWEDRALSDSIEEEKKDRRRIRGYYHQWHPLQWEFRVVNYPVKEYIFKDAAQLKLSYI